VSTAMIELGEVRGDDALAGWPPPERARRRLLLVYLTVFVLLAVVGAVPGRPGLGSPLWTTSTATAGSGFTWGTDTLYVVDPDGRAVSAHDPVTGRLRWRRPLGAEALSVLEVGAGIAAIQIGPAAGRELQPELAVLLIGPTGRLIAQVAGQVWDTDAGGLQLVRITPDCGTANCATLVRIDPVSGAVVWSLSLGAQSFQPAASCQGSQFVVFDGAAAEIRSTVTLALTARLDLPEIEGGLFQTGALYDDELVTAELVEGAVVVTAHPLAAGGPQWTIRLPQGTTPLGVSSGLFLTTCAGLLLAQLADSTALIDRHTGELLRLVPGDLFVVAASDVDSGAAVGPGGIRLALAGPSAGAARSVVLVLAAGASSGTRIVSFPGAAIVGWDAAGGRVLLIGESAERTGFTVVDPRGDPRAVGSVPGVELACRARVDLVACADRHGLLRVWHLIL
jgi:hypothetical protein